MTKRNKPILKGDFFCNADAQKLKIARPVVNTEILEMYFSFVKERYRIHVKKDLLEKKPYTNDPIMQKMHFTNIKREHDYTTRWLIEHISLNSFLTRRNKILNTIAFRFFNSVEMYELIGGPLNFSTSFTANKYAEYLKKHIEENKEKDFPYFSKVLSINPKAINRDVIQDKNFYGKYSVYTPIKVLKYVEQIARTWAKKYGKGKNCISYKPIQLVNTLLDAETQEDVFNILRSLIGVSDYLAYQMFLDLLYIEEFPFLHDGFVQVCGESRMALMMLFTDRDKLTFEECIFWIYEHWPELNRSLPPKSQIDLNKLMIDINSNKRYMTLADIETSLREFEKYCNVNHLREYKTHDYQWFL